MKQVSQFYLEGIKEGRIILEAYGLANISAEERLDNLNRTIKGFDASNPVGQMLRGERDFWKNQIAVAKAKDAMKAKE